MRPSMAHNVGQGFLNDAKGCDLNGGRERRQMFWRGKGYTHVATLLSRDGMFTNSRDQAKFIEHRWTQGIDQAADIGNGRANLPFERLQQCYCFLGLLSHQVAGGIDTLGQAGQGGTKSIMEIAAQPAALFLPGRDQSFARTLEIDGQLDGVDDIPALRFARAERAAVPG